MMIKILFSDFDGTYMLHDYGSVPDSWIPQENLFLTEEYEKAGGRVVITTGRGSPTVLDEMKEYSLFLDVIGANGSAIRKLNCPKTVRYLDPDIYSTLFDRVISVNRNIRYSHYIDDEIQYIYNNLAGSRLSEDDLAAYRSKTVNAFDMANKISLRTNTPREMLEIREMLDKEYGNALTVSVPNDHEVDITAQGVDKGSAIREVLQYYGIAKDEAAGIGDGINDLAIMENVSLRFAMKGSHPELIRNCDQQVESVAEAIRIIMKINCAESEKLSDRNGT
ncbi:MAG: HAD family phosphatase [Erysipelotrichaceae bacterium]|nr:HAD family phosphatase [Erysipelotrichaceae bacterium]